jgi:hypothetical protein
MCESSNNSHILPRHSAGAPRVQIEELVQATKVNLGSSILIRGALSLSSVTVGAVCTAVDEQVGVSLPASS